MFVSWLLLALPALCTCHNSIISFEMEESSTQCFFQDIQFQNESVSLEFLVCAFDVMSIASSPTSGALWW
jgi:hypothetical protein